MNAQLMQSNVWRPTTVFFLLSFFHIQQNDRIAELHKRRLKLGTDHQTIQTGLLLNNFSAINQKLSWAGKCIVSLDRHSVIICKLYFSCFKNRKKTQKALPLSLSLFDWSATFLLLNVTKQLLHHCHFIPSVKHSHSFECCIYVCMYVSIYLAYSRSLSLSLSLPKWQTQ